MPYSNLPDHAFWRLCRNTDNFQTNALFAKSFQINPQDKIGTIGSCFAQNIRRYLIHSKAQFWDAEPVPTGVPVALAQRYGYQLFSARLGNVYTSRQFLQLIQDSLSGTLHDHAIWEKDGRYYDALRPGVDPGGLATPDQVRISRAAHLAKVAQLWGNLDVLIFTLGLTETWVCHNTGQAYPTAPGVIAGHYTPNQHQFLNLRYNDIASDLNTALSLLGRINPSLKIILTVSPVPLTATGSGHHVLSATTYSKSVLRAVAGDMATDHDHVAYFPSYEIITGIPFGNQYFGENLRLVTQNGVDAVMNCFFSAYPALQPDTCAPAVSQPDSTAVTAPIDDDLICEDILLEAFAKP